MPIIEYNSLIPELGITDYNKSIHFYVDIIGFSVEYSRPEEGFAFLSLGSAQLMIDTINVGRMWQTAEFTHPLGRGINFQINVDSVDKIIDNLSSHSISLFMELEEKSYKVNDTFVGNRQFLVQDPDGYLLRFFEEIDPKEGSETLQT